MAFAVDITQFEEKFAQLLDAAKVTDSPTLRFKYSEKVLDELDRLSYEEAMLNTNFRTYVERAKNVAHTRMLLGNYGE